jgi:hypothetical protein
MAEPIPYFDINRWAFSTLFFRSSSKLILACQSTFPLPNRSGNIFSPSKFGFAKHQGTIHVYSILALCIMQRRFSLPRRRRIGTRFPWGQSYKERRWASMKKPAAESVKGIGMPFIGQPRGSFAGRQRRSRSGERPCRKKEGASQKKRPRFHRRWDRPHCRVKGRCG